MISTLKKELTKILIVGVIVLILSFAGLGLVWGWGQATQWLTQTAVLWCLVLYMTITRIGLNRASPEAPLYSTLGWANRLTILRGGLIAITGGFILLQKPSGILAWAPGIIYTSAAIIDRLDGYVARKTGQSSLLGSELDTVFDALGLAVAPLLAVWYGQIHWSYLMVGVAYYLFQWGIYYRNQQGLPVYRLSPNLSRRAIAGYQMGFIAVVLWPLFQAPVTTVAGFAFMLPLLIGFGIDWLIVSGGIDPEKQNIILLLNKLESFKNFVLQPLLRILLMLLLLITISGSDYTIFSSQLSPLTATIFLYVAIVSACLVLLGIAGRIFALVLVGMLGWLYLSYPFGMLDVIMLSSLIWITILGTGAYSLWQRDEDWVNRYDGA